MTEAIIPLAELHDDDGSSELSWFSASDSDSAYTSSSDASTDDHYNCLEASSSDSMSSDTSTDDQSNCSEASSSDSMLDSSSSSLSLSSSSSSHALARAKTPYSSGKRKVFSIDVLTNQLTCSIIEERRLPLHYSPVMVSFLESTQYTPEGSKRCC